MGGARRGFLVLGLSLAGCSALINPDDGRLGDPFEGDAGPALMDGGRADTGVDPGPDGGRDAGADGPDAGPERPDAGPVCPPSCADEVSCTVDTCEAGLCQHAPDDGACPDGQRCSPVLDCVPVRCENDAQCDDGAFCNGRERCDPDAPGTGCVDGAPPVCDDAAACTVDRCDEALDACVFEGSRADCGDGVDCTLDRCAPGPGADGRGCVHEADDTACATAFCRVGSTCDPSGGCGGGAPRDCRDGNPCTLDSCDEGADVCEHVLRDTDGDGFGPISATGSGGTVMCGGMDCDDGDADIHPGATEDCDGVDNDCNGVVDDGCDVPPDACGEERILVFDGLGAARASGRFDQFADDYDTNRRCNPGGGGRDAVYAIDLPGGLWDIEINTFGSSADTVLGVGLTCDPAGLRAACNDDTDRNRTRDSRIWLHRAIGGPGARVYILVDAYDSGETGDFVLNVQRSPVHPDACPSAGGGPLDISGGGTVVGLQSNDIGDHRGSCMPFTDVDGEAVFFVSSTSTTIDVEAYSTDFVPDLYLRRNACAGGTELACDAGGPIGGGINSASFRRTVSSGTNHYLFVDGGRGGYVVYYEPF